MSILRQLFGPSRNEIWRQLAQEIGANYVDGGWGGAKVQAQYGQWTITLDTYAVSTGKSVHHFTRMRAPYVNQDGFRFVISRKHIFTGLAKWLGTQDIELGLPEFDDAFVIQGNDEKKVRALFANEEIRGLVQTQPSLCFSVRGDQGWFSRIFPEGVDELYFQVGGIIKDVDRLKLLFDLFSVTLDELCRMGSAYENDPGVKL